YDALAVTAPNQGPTASRKSTQNQEEYMSRLRTSAVKAVLAGTAFASICMVSSIPALADDDGDDLLKAVKKARLIDLSHNWEIPSPVASVNPFYSFELVATHALFPTVPGGTRGLFGDGGKLSFTAEVQHFSRQHSPP